MPHMHWVARQNKLELPNDEEEVNNIIVVYYEWIKREPKIRGLYECRCDERLQTITCGTVGFCFFQLSQ